MRLMTLILLLMPSTRLVPSGQRLWARVPDRLGRSRREAGQGLDAAAQGIAVPAAPGSGGVTGMTVAPVALQGVAQHTDDKQVAVGCQQFVELHALTRA